MNAPLLIGNNFAVLVAAYEMALRDQHVTLLTDGKPLGGHFGGMQIEGHSFDIGMVLIEKHLPVGLDQDIRTYNPKIRNDWTRFGKIAGDWIEKQVDIRRIPTPTCVVEGKIFPDYLITNRLEAFIDARPQAPYALCSSDERHASHKITASSYNCLSYAEAAKLNHGEVLHSRFIEPFVNKLLNVSSGQFLARYHRTAWVPLYYPETLAGALRGEVTSLSEYPFWTTSDGFIGQLTKNLRDRLVGLPNVTVVTQPLKKLRNEDGVWLSVVEGGGKWFGDQIVLGLTPDRAHTLLGTINEAPSAAASVTLLFALVKANEIDRKLGCHMVVDEEYAAYRLCDQDEMAGLKPEWHRIVIEANTNRLEKRYPNLDYVTALKEELRSLLSIKYDNAVRVLKCITTKNSLVLPTIQQVANAEAACEALANATSGAKLTGSLVGYGVASLNDQIVQGLKINEEFS